MTTPNGWRPAGYTAVEHEVIRAEARAVYMRPLDDGRREIGVEFTDLDGAAMRHINNLFERQ